MQKIFANFMLRDLFHIALENLLKRSLRSLLAIFSIALSTALISSMNLINTSLSTKTNHSYLPFLNLNDYQLFTSVISLIVCIIVIFNSTLISIMERYKEIGTMKCLGAKSSLLLTLFIIESSIIGILGGTMGFVIASLLSIPFFIFTNIFPSAFSYLLSFILSISISLIVSLIATIYPAYYAIRINPADALRFEV